MRRSVSATYRSDLAMLRSRVNAETYAQLVTLAEDIQEARERDGVTPEELDKRIAVYLSVRDQALQEGTG